MQIFIIILAFLIITRCSSGSTDTPQPVEQSSPTSSSSPSRTYIGTSNSGHSMYKEDDGNCIYVVGVRESDIARYGGYGDFKDSVESQTGYSCVLLE